MEKRRKLITSDEAQQATKQLTQPCSDCPWARDALPGWLGSLTVDEWLAEIHGHGDCRIECHAFLGSQCAGASIYRANVLKLPRDPSIVQLPADRKKVFATPMEFKDHHERKGLAIKGSG